MITDQTLHRVEGLILEQVITAKKHSDPHVYVVAKSFADDVCAPLIACCRELISEVERLQRFFSENPMNTAPTDRPIFILCEYGRVPARWDNTCFRPTDHDGSFAMVGGNYLKIKSPKSWREHSGRTGADEEAQF